MASATEGATAKQGIAANLAVGVDTLSENDEVTFTLYVRLVLPIDGYVFWVKAQLLTDSALFNAFQFNESEFNAAQFLTGNTTTFTVKGSFHYSTQQNQNESEIEGVNTVIFTAEAPIQLFNDVQPNTLWIGTYGGDRENDDGPITFAFSARGRYYQAADLFHYSGIAVLPTFRTQLIDSTSDVYAKGQIVSNSLPIWLSLSYYNPPYDNGINCSLPLYPSFLIPDNLPPPYGAIHVEPSQTESLQEAPWFNGETSQYQLCKDRVRVTLYGLSNQAAGQFLAAVMQYSYDYNTIGMLNMPSIRDEKRTAPELNVIAQKKVIDFEVSYNQFALRDVVQNVLKTVIIDYLPQPLSAVGFVPPAP